ncbi:MAG: hypothetical protein M3Y27_19975 [Acidobacteriota bacterium]|nr:hypothetical protein [Acidobacteriota bacterium]
MSPKPQRSTDERDQNGSPEPTLETRLDAIAQNASESIEPDTDPSRP